MHTHYVRNRKFDKTNVMERFNIGISSFSSFIVKNESGGFDVVQDGKLATVVKTPDGILEIVDIQDEKGIFLLMMSLMGVGLTVNDNKPYPGEYTWGTDIGKQNNEPELDNWDDKQLCIIKSKIQCKPPTVSAFGIAAKFKPKPELVFQDRVGDHARHIIPVVIVPGNLLNIPSVPMLPIIILSKVYDGYVGQTTKKYYTDDCCSNWFCFGLSQGKLSFKSDLRYFEGGNVYDDVKVKSAFDKYDPHLSISTLVSSVDESPKTLLSIGPNALKMCNPTPTKQIKYSRNMAITKSDKYKALCRINASVFPFLDGDIVYFINNACDSILVTLDIT